MFVFVALFLVMLAVECFGLPSINAKRVGGIRFLRVHRYQFSFCVCRETADDKRRANLRAV